MRVLISWLRDYVDLPFSIDELADRLPMLGIGVEGVERLEDGDAVFDLEIAANRGDLMGVVGLAREIAAATRSSTRPLQAEVQPDGQDLSDLVRVEVHEPKLCPRFTAAMIVDVSVGPAPNWMTRRLEACGVRSINNIVDVTNYVMLELGQPMHAFDYDRIQGGRLLVRRARAGETLTTLDGAVRALDPQTLVVADAERPAGIAGIIGGAPSEIAHPTRRVLLEAAVWHPPMIRRTSQRLGVRTESSARFERGVDYLSVPVASARAIALMQQLAGGRILRGLIDVNTGGVAPRSVALRWSSVSRLLGIDVPMDEGVAILRGLGFETAVSDRTVRVTVPSHRRDVEREEDLVEEVSRHYGYDRIPGRMPVEIMAQGVRAPALEGERAVRDVLIRAGLTESLTVSLTNSVALNALQLSADHPWRNVVKLRNPLVEDHVQLRTTLLPGLINVGRVNASRGVSAVQIFELGRTFHPQGGDVQERRTLAILMMGRILQGAWNLPGEAAEATFYHLKGVVEALLTELRIPDGVVEAAHSSWLHPGRAARLLLAGETAGAFGELHPDIAVRNDLPPPAYVAEIDVNALLGQAHLRPQFVPLPRFPAVRRDISFGVDAVVPAAEVEAVIRKAGGRFLGQLDVFDVYTGPPTPIGQRNLAYALSFRAPDRTLTADEVEAFMAAITRALEQELGAKIRV